MRFVFRFIGIWPFQELLSEHKATVMPIVYVSSFQSQKVEVYILRGFWRCSFSITGQGQSPNERNGRTVQSHVLFFCVTTKKNSGWGLAGK